MAKGPRIHLGARPFSFIGTNEPVSMAPDWYEGDGLVCAKWQRDSVFPDKSCQIKPAPFWQVGHSYYVAVEVDRIGRALFG